MASSLEIFDEHRQLLFGIAYRMLGIVQDAEDIVQECYLRWQQTDTAQVESPRAFLSAIATRLCIDQLRAARVQREAYVGPWLPEPLATDLPSDPAGVSALAASLSVAFMVLLERLAPAERAVFLLHDIFGYEFGEIAPIVGKSAANCRQIGRRARDRVMAERPRFAAPPDEVERITRQFVHTCAVGDMPGMLRLLAADVELHSDGGGKVAAARRPLLGADAVARFMLGITAKAHGTLGARFAQLNGQPGLIVYLDGAPLNAITLEIRDGLIAALYLVVNPDKLRHVPAA